MRNSVKGGVHAKAKRALGAAAVAGVAGLGLAQGAWADDAAPAVENEVTGVDVVGAKSHLESPKYTAQPLDTPQTVTVVPKAVIEAQNLLSLRDILSTVPGITFGAGEGGGGYGDSINLRGFAATNDIQADGVRDSAQYTRSDPFNLEQLEVVNGASSAYSGAGSVGGTINLVSKRPGQYDSTIVSGGIGTDAYYRGTIDLNRRLSDNVAVRLNAMVHQNDTPGRDVETSERWGIAPSITIGLAGPTQVSLLYHHQEDTNTPQYGVPFYNGRAVPGVDPSDYFGFSNLDTQENTVDRFTAIVEHDFGGELRLRNLSRLQRVDQYIWVNPPQGTYCLADGTKPVGWSQTATVVDAVVTGITTNTTGYAACTGADPAPGYYRPSGPRGGIRDSVNKLAYNQTDLSWTGDFLGARHNLVVGLALTAEEFRLETGNAQRTAAGVAPSYDQMLIADPDHIYTGPLNYIRTGLQYGKRDNVAVYLFDNVEFTEQLSLNFGLRYENNAGSNRSDSVAVNGDLTLGPKFTSEDELISYRAGLVYKPVPNASLYVAYGNSETPSQLSLSQGCNANTCGVEPEKAENIEVGAKYDYAGRLSLTAAVFRNERTNYKVASGDPVEPLEQVLDGSARVDGVALGASGRITDAWSIFANYTYLQSEVLQGVSDYNAGLGLDVTKGDELTNTPNHAFSLFTTYDLPWNIQVGYGVTYQGEYYLTQHGLVGGTNVTVNNAAGVPTYVPGVRTTMPLVKAEDYLVHRLTVAWRATDALELRLNVNNVTDEEYYQRGRNNGWATPGDTRNASLTANYRF